MEMTSMRRPLLVLSEHICALANIEKHSEVALATVETEDKSVAFKPFLAYKKSDKSLTLSVRSVISPMPLLVHCKMNYGFSRTRNNATAGKPDAEAHVTLLPSEQNKDVLTLQARQPTLGFVSSVVPAVPASSRQILIQGSSQSILIPASSQPIPVSSSSLERPSKTIIVQKANAIRVPDFMFKEKVTVTFMVYDATATCPTSGLGQCLNKARLEGDFCDLKLVVGGEELAAHRTVLVARSPVLNKMLTGDFKEAREGSVSLVVDGILPAELKAAMEKFLEYLYTDRILDWGGLQIVLLKLADMYMVPELRADCELELWGCGGDRALEVLHTVGLSDLISRKLRRRLTATVQLSMWNLCDSEPWKEFEKTHPVLADSMLALSSNQLGDGFMLDWSL